MEKITEAAAKGLVVANLIKIAMHVHDLMDVPQMEVMELLTSIPSTQACQQLMPPTEMGEITGATYWLAGGTEKILEKIPHIKTMIQVAAIAFALGRIYERYPSNRPWTDDGDSYKTAG